MLQYENDFITLSTKISDLENFSPSMFVSVCFLEADNKVLLLKTNAAHKPQNNKWSAAGGKIEAGETPLMAVQRELFEETGVKLEMSEFEYITKIFMRNPYLDYEMTIYRANVAQKPAQLNIKISPNEHCEFAWVVPNEALNYDLMHGAKEIIKYTYNLT
jgi:8-oxo-dGTP diphosphatase